MNKKSQAAMEFLLTYGWAILAAIVAIGVLAYTGVFSPGNYFVEEFKITKEECRDKIINYVFPEDFNFIGCLDQILKTPCNDKKDNLT